MRRIFSDETIKSMQDWYKSSYNLGYEEGLRGEEYTGNTFIGYYGWLDSSQGKNRLY